MKAFAVSLLVSLFALVSRADNNAFSLGQNGQLIIGDTTWGTFYQDAKWKPYTVGNSYQRSRQNAQESAGVFVGVNGETLFNHLLTIRSISDYAAAVSVSIDAEAPFAANALMFDGRLPATTYAGRSILVDGQVVELPRDVLDNHVLLVKQARQVVVPIEGGLAIEHVGVVMIVDNRKFGGKDFSVRLAFDPHKGEIRQSEFSAKMSMKSLAQMSLPLSEVANRAFADAVADDGKGGWTDQGPDNDLRSFTPESRLASSIDFTVDFEGPGALVLSRKPDRSNRINAVVNVKESIKPQYLHLLHASAYTWGKVGLIKVIYDDGGEQLIDVNAKQDVGNWWNPNFLPNAAVAWQGKTKDANVGLYESRFALQSKPVKQVAFAAAGEPTWMIVGATLVEGDIPLSQPTTYVVQPGEDWAPIEVPLTIEPGGAFDFSDWTETPAGKHGRVIVTDDGHFAFADQPGKPVRFWGANINFDVNFLNKEHSVALAKRLRQMGYNAVRIHHYDVLLAGGWNTDRYVINEDQLDKLDYLFAAMKEQGLYISTDLFTIRRIRSPDVAAIDGNNLAVFKALIPIMPEAMDDWKRFAKDLLMHRNPYTGMTWADDPALFSICPVNEDTIWAALNSNAVVRELWNAKFEQWYARQPDASKDEATRAAAFNRFLAEKQIASDAEMRRYLHEDLKCQALLTGNNWKNYRAQTPIRAALEYVDNHGYWDHPNFPSRPWNYPFSHSQRSATADRAEVPRRLFLSRIDGLPFMVTEYNYVFPNQFRGEGGPLFGAFAALQDWDGVFRFSWAHKANIVTSEHATEGFDIAQDPINLLSEHIIGMFWRRGDMPRFEEKAVYVVNAEEAFASDRMGSTPRDFPPNATMVGLSNRVGTRYEAEATADNAVFDQEHPRSRYASQVGGARTLLETAGNFLAETEQSKALVVQTESLDTGFVKDVTGGPATVFVGAIDDLPLEQSARILVLHLTNVLPTGMTFSERGMHSIIAPGELPQLVRRGGATIRIVHDHPEQLAVYALDLAGRRSAEPITSNTSDGALEFRAQTILPNGQTVMAYEIAQIAR